MYQNYDAFYHGVIAILGQGHRRLSLSIFSGNWAPWPQG